jgi:hypothetical protein
MSKHKPPPVVFVTLSWDLGIPQRVSGKRGETESDPTLGPFRYVLADLFAKPLLPDEMVQAVMFAFANSMGYVGAERIVQSYLAGESVRSDIGGHGVWHFDFMMRSLGREPPAKKDA